MDSYHWSKNASTWNKTQENESQELTSTQQVLWIGWRHCVKYLSCDKTYVGLKISPGHPVRNIPALLF